MSYIKEGAMETQSPGRKKVRRAVDLPCDVVSRHVDQPLLYWATDLTSDGIWLQTPFPMRPGDEVVVCIHPAVWWPSRELILFAEVVRSHCAGDTGLQGDGMGLRFTDITGHEQRALDSWLRGRPPRLPRRRQRQAHGRLHLPEPVSTLH